MNLLDINILDVSRRCSACTWEPSRRYGDSESALTTAEDSGAMLCSWYGVEADQILALCEIHENFSYLI